MADATATGNGKATRPDKLRREPFSARLLDWWAIRGRHDLPWQGNRTPYRVWVAEIMLQQTRVATVIPYFEQFTSAFPDLPSLARAPLDEVLAHWSGLGYYARARNLHAAALRCLEHHRGELPAGVDELEALPGIGRSTARAIVAQAHDLRAPILDGNVKRVLARHAGIEGWPGRSAVLRRLWQEAEARTPPDRAADYTQAIMDLGATLCTPRRAQCERCPVCEDCVARTEGRVDDLPTPRPRRERPRRDTTLLIIENSAGEILLERRPPAGIWGGLWSLPDAAGAPVRPPGRQVQPPPPMRHQFTHFTLELRFERIRVEHDAVVADGAGCQWVQPAQALALGLPQPIRQVMQQLVRES